MLQDRSQLAAPSSREDSTSSGSGSPELLSWIPISDGFRKQPEQDRLAQLGCKILATGTFRGLGSGTSIWNRLLPQLSNAIPSVNAAAAALGAIYEASLLPNAASVVSRHRAATLYGTAIHHIQQDLSSQLHGPVPLLMSCALLASVELLRNRQSNALAHLQGALRILCIRDQLLLAGTPGQVPSTHGSGHDGDTTPVEDNLSLMFMTLDIQKASYALGQAPDLAVSKRQRLPHASSTMRDLNDAELQLVRIVHSCYHFTAQASYFKYFPRTDIPTDIGLEQGRHIASLCLWLETFNYSFLHWNHNFSFDSLAQALILRSQCLSTFIYVATVLNANETGYDLHGPRFQRIVQDATTVLAGDSAISPELWSFRPSPGIIQPLFFTAIKYRQGSWRRQAIKLLQQCGREGPFDGKILAPVASRAVQIEERARKLGTTQEIIPDVIPERDRLHGCGIDAEAKDDEPLHSVTVMFSRCYDVELMLSGSESWDHSSNWDIWDEVIGLQP
jgi:hypothetical protein